MSHIQHRKWWYCGLLFLAIGLLMNQWVIQATSTRDGHIESWRFKSVIIAFQLVMLSVSAYFFVKKPALKNLSFKNVALALASLCTVLFVFEIGSRIWLHWFATADQYSRYALFTQIPDQNYQWARHPYLNYYPNPSYRNELTRHNSLGYRNQEFPVHKPEGAYRLALLGGSTTYTIKVPDNAQTFPSQLEHTLRDRYGYQQVEVINAGAGGYTSWESLVNLEFRVLDLEPDAVIVYQGVNDVHARLVASEDYAGDNSGYRQPWRPPKVLWFERSCFLRTLGRYTGLLHQVSLGSFVIATETYHGCHAKYLASTPLELLCANPPIYFERNLLNMIAIAKAHNISIILTTWAYSPFFDDCLATPAYQQGIEEHNQLIRRLAQQQQIPLLDFASRMPQNAMYWADGSHVNAEGASVKADIFAEFLHKSGLLPGGS
jgi:lysophospholipase L1-like esterase